MNPKIALQEDLSVEPLCPHCEQPIRKIGMRQIESMLGVRFLYFCGECRKVLGVSHRKGFWMG
jgi:hypothetical protein